MGREKAALAFRVQVRLLGKAILGEDASSIKGAGMNRNAWSFFIIYKNHPMPCSLGKSSKISCQSGLPLPFNLNMPKWARGFIFVLLHCLPPTHLCFPLRCLWLLLILLFPVLAFLLGKLCGLPPFLAPFSTSLMVQKSFWLFLFAFHSP